MWGPEKGQRDKSHAGRRERWYLHLTLGRAGALGTQSPKQNNEPQCGARLAAPGSSLPVPRCQCVPGSLGPQLCALLLPSGSEAPTVKISAGHRLIGE